MKWYAYLDSKLNTIPKITFAIIVFCFGVGLVVWLLSGTKMNFILPVSWTAMVVSVPIAIWRTKVEKMRREKEKRELEESAPELMSP